MKSVGLIGLGKLGLPAALAMEARGSRVFGYDLNDQIKNYLQEKKVPFKEEGIEKLLETTQLEVVDSIETVVKKADLIFCAIQTPHDPKFEGDKPMPEVRADFDYSYLKKAIKDVASAAKKLKKKINLIVISTCLPGTYKKEVKPLLNPNINYVYNPYFIAMGTVINDFYNPELILIGKDEGDITPVVNFYKQILGDKKIFITDITTAEGIKVFYNTFVTTKTVLGNLYGEFAHRLGMNVDHIYDALSMATDRLISPKYLKSGMGDGGGCHPRDNIALSYLAEKLNMSFNFFDSLMTAREKHTGWLADLFQNQMRVSKLEGIILGKAFKPETEIQTGSPAILLANILKRKKTSFKHYEFDFPEDLPVAVYFIATRHGVYKFLPFPPGSVVIDPFRYIPKHSGVDIIAIGRQE